MLAVISPAKTLDFDAPLPGVEPTQPLLLEEAEKLVKNLAKKSQSDIASMMHLSEKLASLNVTRYRQFTTPFTPENAKPALTVFKGDVYKSLELDQYSDEDYCFAQKHLRMLSGLYGLLRPMDLMQAYRLEMGTKLANERGEDLYDFWGEKITAQLNQDLANDNEAAVLVNLASNEYWKSVRPKSLKAEVVTPVFKEIKDGKPRVIALFAKRARGMMVNYMIRQRITEPEKLKKFTEGGYHYDGALSSSNEWVFVR
jgi:cytoplasmic iron level regulating protein YaaA (DUF328/UPF0246 family)